MITLAKSGNDIVTSGYGTSHTFTNGYSVLDASDWNLIGFSIGVLGSSTNGIVCLWVGNVPESSCITSPSFDVSSFVTNVSPGTGNMVINIGNTFTGTIGQVYVYDYVFELTEYLKI